MAMASTASGMRIHRMVMVSARHGSGCRLLLPNSYPLRSATNVVRSCLEDRGRPAVAWRARCIEQGQHSDVEEWARVGVRGDATPQLPEALTEHPGLRGCSDAYPGRNPTHPCGARAAEGISLCSAQPQRRRSRACAAVSNGERAIADTRIPWPLDRRASQSRRLRRSATCGGEGAEWTDLWRWFRGRTRLQ